MSKLDLDSLLTPVSDTAPNGEDAAYIPDFQQLEEAANGRPEGDGKQRDPCGLLRTKRAGRTGTADAGPEVTPSTDNGAPAEATPSPGGELAMPRGGSIPGRENVVRMLDRICDYYGRNEPSSPVPLGDKVRK